MFPFFPQPSQQPITSILLNLTTSTAIKSVLMIIHHLKQHKDPQFEYPAQKIRIIIPSPYASLLPINTRTLGQRHLIDTELDIDAGWKNEVIYEAIPRTCKYESILVYTRPLFIRRTTKRHRVGTSEYFYSWGITHVYISNFMGTHKENEGELTQPPQYPPRPLVYYFPLPPPREFFPNGILALHEKLKSQLNSNREQIFQILTNTQDCETRYLNIY